MTVFMISGCVVATAVGYVGQNGESGWSPFVTEPSSAKETWSPSFPLTN